MYELIGYNTENYKDIRYLEYTSSKKRAKAFDKIPKIQFTDSGHGIVFNSRELEKGEKIKKPVYILLKYVNNNLEINIAKTKKICKECEKLKAENKSLRERATELNYQIYNANITGHLR